jgi:molybdenum cofactor biosynthesis protein B
LFGNILSGGNEATIDNGMVACNNSSSTVLTALASFFRSLSYHEIGTGSILSRAIAGVARGKVILCLPGSLGAVTLAMDRIILPEIGHLVREATRLRPFGAQF